jgi:hypothetical protein
MSLTDLRIDTPRLLLRVPTIDDLDPWAAMMTDEEAAKFIGGVMPRSVTWRALMTMIGSWHATGFAMFLRHRGRDRRDELGVRSPRLGSRHPQHRSGQHRFAAGGEETRVAEPGPRHAAAAVPGCAHRHLGAVARGMAGAARVASLGHSPLDSAAGAR